MKMRKWISLLLALVMVTGLLPAHVLALEGETPPLSAEPAPEETEQASAEAIETEEISAPESQTPAEQPPELSVIANAAWVNPQYAQLNDIVTTPTVPLPMARSNSMPNNLTTMAKTLRENLVARSDYIDLYCDIPANPLLSEEEMLQQLNAIWEQVLVTALEHTDVANQGDYLTCHLSFVAGGIGYDDSDPTRVYILLEYVPTYLTTAEQEAEVEKKVDQIIKEQGLLSLSTYERIKAVYDYMTANIIYDEADLNDDSDLLKYTAYGALVEGSAVSQGYASLFYYFMQKLYVDCRVITGIGGTDDSMESNIWNIVRGIGGYYNVDCARDAVLAQSGLDYQFFLKCPANFPEHTRDAAFETDAFHQAYPMATEDYPLGITSMGPCGDSVSYKIDTGNNITIYGTGPMYDYNIGGGVWGGNDGPWADAEDRLKTLIVEEGVTHIGRGAFYGAVNMTEASFPLSLKSIGDGAFDGCAALTQIHFWGDAPQIGAAAFRGVTVTAYYPADNPTWDNFDFGNYGGSITWEPYRAEGVKFDIAFANMTLGNSLAMNFAFPQSGTDNWEGAYAQVAKTYADGRGTKVISVPISQWGTASIGGEPHYTLTFNGIAAKEMADEIYITVYNGDKNPISNTWEDSVRSYAMRTLANPATTAATATMVVDMLNYGAAAQQSFGYDTGNLANSQLTDSQKALATPSAWAEDGRIKGENYLGTQLRLESQIMLRMAFSGVTENMTAQVSFTDHYDRPQSYTIPGSDFEINDNTAVIMIDKIVLADARNDVTVQIMDSDGNVVASATDSVAGYIARMRQEVEDPLYESILKFADSAYLYFHPGAQLPTAPEHSDLYIPGLSQDQAVAYFNEVCFGSEYGSNTPYICKWTEPISYAVYGDPTDTDMQMLENFVAELNTIEGFPGLTEYTGSGYVDWEIHFCQEDEMAGIVGDWAAGGGFEGTVTIWYNNQCEITDSAIAIRVDLDQATRSSVILEEIYNGLGPLMDTEEREDSIIYQYGSSVTELSDIDWLILQLLYSEEVKAGMDKVECEAVLRSLYW